MNDVKIFLRTVDSEQGVEVGTVPLESLLRDEVDPVCMIGRWGIAVDGDLVDRDRLVGQFFLDTAGKRAGFEVIVAEE